MEPANKPSHAKIIYKNFDNLGAEELTKTKNVLTAIFIDLKKILRHLLQPKKQLDLGNLVMLL